MATKTAKSKEEILDFLECCYNDDFTPENMQELYKEWSKNYDEEVKTINYVGPDKFVAEFCKLNLPKDSKILDVGAGTGRVGMLLSQKGYTNIDALDGTPKMLEVAKKKGVPYKKCTISFLGEGYTVPIESNTYDVVLACGSVFPGHIYIDAFPELIRIAKPGATIMWIMQDPKVAAPKSEKYREGKFEAGIQALCDSGHWKTVRQFVIPEWYNKEDGPVFIMQKTRK